MKNKKYIMLLVTLSIMFLLGACSSSDNGSSDNGSSDQEDPIKISYAFFAPAETAPGKIIQKWADEVESRTDGKVEVEVFYSGSLLGAENMFEGIESGVADMGLTLPSHEPGRFPLLEISDIVQYPSSEVASQVIYDLAEEYPPEPLDRFKVVTFFTSSPHYIQSVDPIRNLEDMKGKQLRIPGGLTPMLEKFGASPAGTPQNEVPEALQTGIIEGNVSSKDVLKDLKLAEIVNYVTDYPFSVANLTMVMNQEKWDSLPEDVQEVIDELSREISDYGGLLFDEHAEVAEEWSIENEGLEVLELSEEEREKWLKISTEAREDKIDAALEKGLPAEEYVDRMNELIEKYSQDESN